MVLCLCVVNNCWFKAVTVPHRVKFVWYCFKIIIWLGRGIMLGGFVALVCELLSLTTKVFKGIS